MSKKSKTEPIENIRFDQQEHLVKYITGFFGYTDVQVNITGGYRGEGEDYEELKICIFYSKDQMVYEIIKGFFNRIFESSYINEEGELEMVQPITYDEKEKGPFVTYFRKWESEFNQILMDFIKMTLKPML